MIDTKKRLDLDFLIKSVKEKRASKTARDSRIAWNKKNSQKFSEYYLKLEKELIRYNVEVNKNNYTKRRKKTMDKLKHELKEGQQQMKEKQSIKLEDIIEKNRFEQNKLDSLKRYLKSPFVKVFAE